MNLLNSLLGVRICLLLGFIFALFRINWVHRVDMDALNKADWLSRRWISQKYSLGEAPDAHADWTEYFDEVRDHGLNSTRDMWNLGKWTVYDLYPELMKEYDDAQRT